MRVQVISSFIISAMSLLAINPAMARPGTLDVSYLGAPPGALGGSSGRLTAGGYRKPWIFTAPPRGTRAQQEAMYAPIARFLSHAAGHKIVYREPGNWLTYSRAMTEGKYDIVFDGPHFTSWRDRYLGDMPLVRLPEPFVFAVVVRRGERFTKLSQLAGQPVCANSPPNLGTLSLLSQFSYITRQPYLVVVHGWPAAYKGLMDKRCGATVLPIANLKLYEKGRHTVRTLYRTPVYPNQAISAGPRVPAGVQARIRAALLSPAGQAATRTLRHAYGAGRFVPANRRDYAGLSHLLNNTLYFSGGGQVGIAQR